MKRQNRIKPETLYNVSEKNSMCMETSQRPAILNQKYKKDEETQRNDVKKAKEPHIKKKRDYMWHLILTKYIIQARMCMMMSEMKKTII